MARKPAPKIDPKELYEEKIVYVIEFVESTIYGKFYGTKGDRAQALREAVQFPTYEDAYNTLIEKMLEGVKITKVWV